ncbi:MAG: hypothetical protein LQ343_005778 [Gyalolechia ehrenbergii]|nr:MAG: hypothetical protein LQ343_005778 [Gyalolechia ehrenbergii]
MLAQGNVYANPSTASMPSPISPNDHPHASRSLKDHNAARENIRNSPQKPVNIYEDGAKRSGMHKRNKSSVSLKSLIGNDKAKPPRSSMQQPENAVVLKRPKSSTGLSALLSRSKTPKGPKLDCKSPIKDKENRTPPQTADIVPPPIWAQFTTQRPHEAGLTTTVHLNDRVNIEREATLYTPQESSPSKQRNFYDYRPTLARKTDKKLPSPSELIDSTETNSYNAEALSRVHQGTVDGENPVKERHHEVHAQGSNENPVKGKTQQNVGKGSNGTDTDDSSTALTKAKLGSRVMAAVAALNCNPGDAGNTQTKHLSVPIMDVKAIEREFETLLLDFIRKEKFASGSVSSTESPSSADSRDASKKRPNTSRSNVEEQSYKTDDGIDDRTEDEGSPKKRRSRPRSRTFTFSKSDSSSKKKDQSERSKSRGRSRSRARAPEAVETPQTPEARRSFSFGRIPKPAIPEDFLSYLRKTQKPQDVEVGRLQKLRQVLRNETVGWVDAFINQQGMTEIIGLLYRILNVEWRHVFSKLTIGYANLWSREDHEDTLLHETLLCLKAMCTTSVALDQLSSLAPTLFPTLLNMIFDEQRKGPNEFTTRNVVMSLLFIHLTAASPANYKNRAKDIIQYLRDPTKPEEAQPPGFIASMHHPRPYRVWCKEMINVTKEVFWIFIHHVNVIPYPEQGPKSAASTNDGKDYRKIHFPQPRPPIPAAPYIGGVEWDATNYLATHLDLLNGLIACLPTREERNKFRQELKDSGLEKCMGGSLRTCKEKWYGYVHACLTTWVGAAQADGWNYKEVREGGRREDMVMSVSPKKGKKVEEAPKLEIPKFDLGVRVGKEDDGGWL